MGEIFLDCTPVLLKSYVMAHPKVKESSSIITILQPALQLDNQQVKLLEQLEYEWYRSYQFDVPKFNSSRAATVRGLRQFLPILQQEQIEKLKVVWQENKKEHNIYDQADMERRSVEHLFDVLKFLKLRPEQEKLVNRLCGEKSHLRIDECLEHLEPTLDAEQEVELNKYREKQNRLFWEGQENQVHLVFEYLALSEEQFQEVVEYHAKNYWRTRLPLEELREDAEFMKKILTEEQWEKYKSDWDRRMVDVKRQMVTDEESNKFNLLWVRGLYEYTKEIVHPKYLTYRQRFEEHLKSEERMFINSAREKAKEYNEERLRKGDRDRSSTEMEASRIWIARANLMPSVGSSKTKELEKGLKKIAIRHALTLNEYLIKLKEVNRAYREFTANFYEEIGGTYGPNVMVHRDEEERAKELWKMNFLLLDPNPTPA